MFRIITLYPSYIHRISEIKCTNNINCHSEVVEATTPVIEAVTIPWCVL